MYSHRHAYFPVSLSLGSFVCRVLVDENKRLGPSLITYISLESFPQSISDLLGNNRTRIRKIMSNQIDDKDDDLSANVVEPDENEWRKFMDE